MARTLVKKTAKPNRNHRRLARQLMASFPEPKPVALHYVEDGQPGIRRQARGDDFRYVAPDGKTVKSPDTLRRIRSLVIPPAWTDVWICPSESGHIQATGRDARGRKQYRYHPQWIAEQDQAKYERMLAFAAALPKIRRRVHRDLRARGLPRHKVLAAVVKLLESTLIRVGNDEYARENRSFGLTTMRDGHVDVNGTKIQFDFRGKSGIEHDITIRDPRLARIVGQCQQLPGQELFQYLDEAEEVRDIGSADVNEYLREISGSNFTAKDFRTWAGTTLAAQALQEFQDFDSQAAAKRNITQAIERVAKRLGNTKAVCRKCYVHPAVIDAYLDRSLLTVLKKRTEAELKTSLTKLSSEEAAVLALLQQRMERDLKKAHSGRTQRKSRH